MAISLHTMPLKNDHDETIARAIFRDASTAVALEDAYNKLRDLSEKDTLTA